MCAPIEVEFGSTNESFAFIGAADCQMNRAAVTECSRLIMRYRPVAP